jgi:hypothetical protein
MIKPGRLALSADRWTAFVASLTFRKDGADVDLSGAAMRLQIRTRPDAAGSALIDLGVVGTSSAQGIRIFDPVVVDGHDTTTIGIRVNETTMEGLPFPADRGADLKLFWDLHVTPAGGLKQRWMAGDFIVRAGVTE